MKLLFKNRELEFGKKTLIMGIHNATLDSFSDGGKYLTIDSAVEHCIQMLQDGADIIDIGGESTKPGDNTTVSVEEELKRVIPVITALKKSRPDSIVSIDTMKFEVAKEAINSGADIINDVSGLKYSQEMAKVAAETQVGLILMHMKGTPKSEDVNYQYNDLLTDITFSLKESAKLAESFGVNSKSIILDPGLGGGSFGKTPEQSLELIRRVSKIKDLGYPVLLGASRKGFLGKLINENDPEKRICANLAVAAWAEMQNVSIIRVHDVKETFQFLKVFSTLRS